MRTSVFMTNSSVCIDPQPTANGMLSTTEFGSRPLTQCVLATNPKTAQTAIITNSPFGSPTDTVHGTTSAGNIAIRHSPANTSTHAQIAAPAILCTPAPKDATTSLTQQTRQNPILNQQHPNLPTPIKPSRLAYYLQGYDEGLTQYILDGFRNGFSLHTHNFKNSSVAPHNSSIAMRNPDAVTEKITKELQLNHIAGPFTSPPMPNFHVSPLSLRPKSDNSGWRLLHDLSFPYNDDSVNSSIPDNYKKVQYSSIQNAINLIQQIGPNTNLCKSDIQSAFTLIPIHPEDYHLLGFKWQDQLYHYTTLPQGAASSCYIFETVATALHWILTEKFKLPNVIHYLDDFLFLHPTPDGCKQMLTASMVCAKTLEFQSITLKQKDHPPPCPSWVYNWTQSTIKPPSL